MSKADAAGWYRSRMIMKETEVAFQRMINSAP